MALGSSHRRLVDFEVDMLAVAPMECSPLQVSVPRLEGKVAMEY